MDLIDEDSLLTEEDLKKPQLPTGKSLWYNYFLFFIFYTCSFLYNLSNVIISWSKIDTVGDCEIGSSRKACKNCTCGRAEAEQKVEKLGLTMEQLDNPQSACGSVCVK